MYNKSYYSLLFYIHRFRGLEKLGVESSDVRGDNITSSVMLSVSCKWEIKLSLSFTQYTVYSHSCTHSFMHLGCLRSYPGQYMHSTWTNLPSQFTQKRIQEHLETHFLFEWRLCSRNSLAEHCSRSMQVPQETDFYLSMGKWKNFFSLWACWYLLGTQNFMVRNLWATHKFSYTTAMESALFSPQTYL